MNLDEVRVKINVIDGSMKELFDARMECSFDVAKVKMETSDEVFKPDREKAICEKFADDKSYQTFVKKIMQISRKYQYGIFADNDILKDKFTAKLTDDNKKVLTDGGELVLKLSSDETFSKGLPVKDIISFIADTKLDIISLSCKDGNVDVVLDVPADEISRKEALLLTYMLYMETL